MYTNIITELLGIKEKYIEIDHVEMLENELHVDLSTKVRKVPCKQCKHKTNHVHSYRKQKIQGAMIHDKKVYLYLRKRRYKCMECGSTFYESLTFVDRYQRRTTALNQQALTYLADASFTTAAKMSGITPSSLLRIFDKRQMKQRRVLPKVIAIDEFKGDAEKVRFQTVIVDVEKKEIIEILPDRRAKTIEDYLISCDTGRVQIVVMDMSRAFKSAVQKALGNPIIVADRFHFMRQGYWALDRVRREVQHSFTKADRLLSKRNKKLLWLAPEKLDKLSGKGKERIQKLLSLHPDLKEAYRLKNALHHWFKTSDAYNVKEQLYAWYEEVARSPIREFDSVIKTFKNWEKEIIQAFIFPYNNGFIEGVNNTIKVMKRMSYGIKSFERLRKKILFRQAIRTVD